MVTPEESAALTACVPLNRNVSLLSVVICSYASASELQCIWECISMNPGRIDPPGITSVSALFLSDCVSWSEVQTFMIFPSSVTTAPFFNGSDPEPSISLSDWIIYFMNRFPSLVKLWALYRK